MRTPILTKLTTCIALCALVACDRPAPANADAKAAADEVDAKAAEAPPEQTAEPETKTEPGTPLTPLASGEVLAFGPAKIMREGHADRAFELQPDGKLTLAGNPYGSMVADGRYLDAGGTLLMTVKPDGIVEGEGNPSGITLTNEGGQLVAKDLEIDMRIEADGTVKVEATGKRAQLLGEGGPQLTSEGCTGDIKRACSLVILSYLMARGNPDSAPEPE